MKSNNEIITDILPMIDEIIKNFLSSQNYKDDFRQEIIMILLQMDNKKLNTSLEGKWLKYLVINIITNQFKSSTSPFYRKYRLFELDKRYVNVYADGGSSEYDEDLCIHLQNKYEEYDNVNKQSNIIHTYLTEIEEVLRSVYWYDKELFCMYFKLLDYNPIDGLKRITTCNKDKMSLRDISKRTGIHHNSIGQSINNTIELIKQNLKINT